MDNVLEVMDEQCAHLRFDMTLARRVKAYQIGFVNKNTDHAEFFGGHLVGTTRVRFMPSDEAKWFDEVMEADYSKLKETLHALPTINPKFNVSSSIFNLSCVWMMHRFFTSEHLSEKLRHEAAVDVLLSLHYQFITSMIVKYFKWPANPEVAEAAFRNMSMKFAIKQHGTWYAVLRDRALDVLSDTSTHYKCVRQFDDDLLIVKMLNDMQGRINSMICWVMDIFIQTHKAGERINLQSSTMDSDGEEILRDKVGGYASYIQYIKRIVTDESDFIRDILLKAVVDTVKTSPERLVRQTLVWMSEEYTKSPTGEVNACIDEILFHAFEYVNDHQGALRHNVNIAALCYRLKGIYGSSRSTDIRLLNIREKTEEIVTRATKKTNANVVKAVRTAVMLYIVTRTFSRNKFS